MQYKLDLSQSEPRSLDSPLNAEIQGILRRTDTVFALFIGVCSGLALAISLKLIGLWIL